MGARKNRPDKYRGADPTTAAPTVLVETTLVRMLREEERRHPHEIHYVGWPDMNEAKALAKRGFLTESAFSLGCFSVTDKFRAASRG